MPDLDPRFNADEVARLAAVMTAPDTPESLRERVAEAMSADAHWRWADADEPLRDIYRRMADQAIAVITEDARA